ncbi:MAG: tRNA lysidine(34) synthetase TilS [Treponema sp.]|nr:tRNA lysidine(34) synthetase TilS [Treponema sp.]
MFEHTVAAALKNCLPGEVCLAAVSGGADSTAMLAALAAINEREGHGFKLHCITIDHGIRPEADSRGDVEFVRSLCSDYHIPCRIVSVLPGKVAALAKKRGIGIEAAARLYRRRAWFREAKQLNAVRIFVAHTADDMLETALMRILRGAGPSGLAAMPANKGRIVRPLLTLNRSDVIGYLKEKRIPWREDSTNADIHYLRNRIRHELIPQLNNHFPQWRKSLASFAQTQSLTAEFIKNEAAGRITWVLESGIRDGYLHTDANNFFSQPAIIREEALFQGINKLVQKPLDTSVKRTTIRHFSDGGVKAADCGSFKLLHENEYIIISVVQKTGSEYGFSLLINMPGLYTLKEITIEVCEIPADAPHIDDGFLTLLPMVVRPCFKDDRVDCHTAGGHWLTAADPAGPAAFIDYSGILRSRSSVAEYTGKHYVVRILTNKR